MGLVPQKLDLIKMNVEYENIKPTLIINWKRGYKKLVLRWIVLSIFNTVISIIKGINVKKTFCEEFGKLYEKIDKQAEKDNGKII